MNILKSLEKLIGSFKFAIVCLVLYIIGMIVGTFAESYFGTDFANRTVYKTFPFLILQFAIYLSIFYATLQRLPFKKSMLGFYVLHLGLLLIYAGSFITFFVGIDGQITLRKNTPSRSVVLSEDQLIIKNLENKVETQVMLPYTAFTKDLDMQVNQFLIQDFIPYAKTKVEWKTNYTLEPHSSSHYGLKNDNFDVNFYLTLNPYAIDFKNIEKMGPLAAIYLPGEMFDCLKKVKKSKVLFYDTKENTCFTPEDKNIVPGLSKAQKTQVKVSYKAKNYLFNPETTPWPLNKDMSPIKDSPLKAFSLKIFEKKPTVLLFGKSLAFYDKDDQTWSFKSFDKKFIDLPWMGFEITLLRHDETMYPQKTPIYTYPIQDQGKLIVGDLKALKVKVANQSLWVTGNKPLEVNVSDQRYRLSLSKKSIELPFELTLNTFKMDKDPGTNTPASFESFVNLFTGDSTTKHHIFMNNPLKFDGLTFYQASYFEESPGLFGSVLSVNYDPGRFAKYFGSLLLVLGSAWHFYLRKKIKIFKF